MAERGKRVLDEGEEQSVNKKKIKKSVDITIGGLTLERTQTEIEIEKLIDEFLRERLFPNRTKDEKRIVMQKIVAMLKSQKYDVSVSTTRSDSPGAIKFPGMSYRDEYTLIDIKVDEDYHVLVDIDFYSKFELFDPRKEYREIMSSVPIIFLGTKRAFERVVACLCEHREKSERITAVRLYHGLELD